ncbi:MAG: hypothetical protein HQK79_03580 [Desulfobacterales bacterium]|nr:hypothetical protein [Desulfobacterales bacterium]
MKLISSKVVYICFLLLFCLMFQITGCDSTGSDKPAGSSSSDSSSSTTTTRKTATITLTAAPTSIPADGKSSSDITAELKDNTGQAVSKGTQLTFSTTRGTFSNNSTSYSTETADDTGRMTVALKASTSSGTAEVTCTSNNVSQKTNVEMTSSSTTTRCTSTISLSANPTSIPADGQTSTDITATLKDSTGKSVPINTEVKFSTTLGKFSNGSTSYTTNTTDDSGVIVVSLKASTTGGTASITCSATCNSNTVSQKTSVEMTESSGGGGEAPGDPKAIEKSAVQMDPVYIKNSGKPESTKITFEVKDQKGNLVADDHTINFSIVGGGVGGGEALTSSSDKTVGGKVNTTLKSGTKSGTVKIRAEYSKDTSIFTDVTITIAGGPPYGAHLGLDPEYLNIAGLAYHGLDDKMTTTLTDIYFNTVPDGTSVYFTTNYAGITPSDTSKSSTDSGNKTSYANATLTSQTPDPTDGFVNVATSTQSGAYASVLSILIDPNDNKTIYLGTDGGGIFKTTDSASTWSQIGVPEKNLRNGIVNDIKFLDTTNTAIVLAATNTGVFKTTGGGDKWELITGYKERVGESLGTLDTTHGNSGYSKDYSLKYNSNSIYSKMRVYIKGEETHQYVFVNAKTIKFIVTEATTPYVSDNKGGSHYTGESITVDYQTPVMIRRDYNIKSMAIFDTNTIYVGTYGGGVYKSTDAGYTWDAFNNGLENQDVLSLAIDTANNILYAATDGGGVYKSTDGGANWSAKNKGLAGSVINAMLIDVNDTSKIYACTEQYGMYRSGDKAENWLAPTTNVTSKKVNTIAMSSKTGKIYVGTYGDGTNPLGGVYVSSDSGATWSRPVSLNDNHVYAIGIIPVDTSNDTLFAGTWGRNIFKSTNSGQSWTTINGQSPDELTNNIFATEDVLFSGKTDAPLMIQDYTTYQGAGGYEYKNGGTYRGYLYNEGSATFIFRVADFNGNPLVKGTKITASVDNGILSSDPTETIEDKQFNKNYYVTWQNNITGDKNISGTLTLKIDSQNGGYITSVSRTLVRPVQVTISPTAPAANASISVTPKGGSETSTPSGGGYTVTCNNGTSSTCNFGSTVTCTAGATKDVEEKITIQDNVTGRSATTTYTVK